MCGRFALALRVEPFKLNILYSFHSELYQQPDEIEQLDAYPALNIDQWLNRDRFVPRYNVAPRTHAPVIRRAQPGEPALVMHSMRWGLVPHWSKAEPPTLNTINARAENLEEGGGMWGSIKGRKRCVVVAQGYVSPSSRTSDGPFSCAHTGTTNGSKKARIASLTLRDIQIGGSCYLPACTTR